MREILFRGKRCDNGEWVQGFYVRADYHWHNKGIHKDWIICGAAANGGWFALHNKYAVVPDTVGQFTGLTDRNGKRIFEGDIFKADNGSQSCIAVVKFGEYFPKMFYDMLCMLNRGVRKIPAKGFYAETVDKHEEIILFQSPCVEVIGDIHDNPELLEVDE